MGIDSTNRNRLCLACGYVIDHLPEPRCPECGCRFDLADELTFRWSDAKIKEPLNLKRALAAASVFFVLILVAESASAPADMSIFWFSVPLAGVIAGMRTSRPAFQAIVAVILAMLSSVFFHATVMKDMPMDERELFVFAIMLMFMCLLAAASGIVANAVAKLIWK